MSDLSPNNRPFDAIGWRKGRRSPANGDRRHVLVLLLGAGRVEPHPHTQLRGLQRLLAHRLLASSTTFYRGSGFTEPHFSATS